MPKRSARMPDKEAATTMARARQAFSERVAALIPAGGVDAAADWLGVDRSTIYRWQTPGDRQPGLFHSAALAVYLKVPLGDLLGEHTPERLAIRPESRRVLQALENPDHYSVEELMRLFADAVGAARTSTAIEQRPAPNARSEHGDETMSSDANNAGSSAWKIGDRR